MIKPSSVTKRNIMEGTGKGLGMIFTPPLVLVLWQKISLLEDKPKTAPRCFRNINDKTKHFALMVLPILNPLNHTWATSGHPTGQKRYFGPKQPFCQGEDYFAYFKLAENPSKSGNYIELKSNSPFLGDIGLIKLVFLFEHPMCNLFLSWKWPFLAKVPIFTCPKMALSSARMKILRPLL